MYVAVRKTWQTFHVATQRLESAVYNSTVGTKLQAMEVAFKRTTTHEILHRVSGQLCSRPKSPQQRELHCPPPVLFVVVH